MGSTGRRRRGKEAIFSFPIAVMPWRCNAIGICHADACNLQYLNLRYELPYNCDLILFSSYAANFANRCCAVGWLVGQLT